MRNVTCKSQVSYRIMPTKGLYQILKVLTGLESGVSRTCYLAETRKGAR